MQRSSDLQDRQALGGRGGRPLEDLVGVTPEGGEAPASPPAEVSAPKTLAELIAAAREVRPARAQCCGHCFGEGRDAALAVIEGGLLAG